MHDGLFLLRHGLLLGLLLLLLDHGLLHLLFTLDTESGVRTRKGLVLTIAMFINSLAFIYNRFLTRSLTNMVDHNAAANKQIDSMTDKVADREVAGSGAAV